MLNRSRTISIYPACDKPNILFLQSHQSLIPRIKLASPKSFISNWLNNQTFTNDITPTSLPMSRISSTHAFVCFIPCFMLRSMFLHAYMFRSTCLGFYAMFPLFRSSFCFMLKFGLCAHMLDICLWLCFAQIFVFLLFAMFYI